MRPGLVEGAGTGTRPYADAAISSKPLDWPEQIRGEFAIDSEGTFRPFESAFQNMRLAAKRARHPSPLQRVLRGAVCIGGVMEEREAIARLKKGDIGGLEPLVRVYYARAVQAAYLVVNDWALAEDVAQGAFVNAFEKIGSFDSKRPFGPWFFRSVVRAAMRIPAGWRDVSLELYFAENEPAIPDPEPGVEFTLLTLETREEVLAMLDRLSPAQRAAVVMKYYLDLSDAEVSKRLDVPEGTIRRRLHDARKSLRRLFGADASMKMWLPSNESGASITLRKETRRD